MQIGIIGLPQTGKTALFQALAGGEKAISAFASGQLEIHTAVAQIPDQRVDRLAEIFHPKKTVYAQVTFADIAGLDKGLSKKGLPGPFVNLLGQMDAFVHVVRAFENPAVAHSEGSINPVRDLALLDTEFLLQDLTTVERRYERLLESLKKGAVDRDLALKEKILLENMRAALEEEKPLRDLGLSPEEIKPLRGYGFLSLKPVLVVVNTGDEGKGPEVTYSHQASAVVHLSTRLEKEISELSPDDAALFMKEYAITELSRSRVLQLSYDLLGLQSFFTVGEDEVRAWTLKRGATGLEAAAAIHSDLARGFIRAEVVGFEELIELGGLNQVKQKGRLRLEGKEYVVRDGEIVHIRHSG
ncbi:MAG: redox-regulated ATPase YchF [Deltaproteobacteria bacterium]|nr:redox-regulated ATPase YchF [Deltaproteobacteria bacterium]